MAADSDVSYFEVVFFVIKITISVDCQYLFIFQTESEVFEITDFTTASEWERQASKHTSLSACF